MGEQPEPLDPACKRAAPQFRARKITARSEKDRLNSRETFLNTVGSSGKFFSILLKLQLSFYTNVQISAAEGVGDGVRLEGSQRGRSSVVTCYYRTVASGYLKATS